MKICFWICSLVGCGLFAGDVHAQHSAPVIETYFSPVSVEPQPNAKLSVAFTFNKDGGPSGHDQRQAHVLLYLKRNEAEILQIAKRAAAAENKDEDIPPFVRMLTEEKLVVSLGTRSARRLHSDNEDGYPYNRQSYPFQFTFDKAAMYDKLLGLEGFRFERKTELSGSFVLDNAFGLIIYIPMNNSEFATLIPEPIKKLTDFGKAYRSWSPVLFFRPLAYEFQFPKFEEGLELYIVN